MLKSLNNIFTFKHSLFWLFLDFEFWGLWVENLFRDAMVCTAARIVPKGISGDPF